MRVPARGSLWPSGAKRAALAAAAQQRCAGNLANSDQCGFLTPILSQRRAKVAEGATYRSTGKPLSTHRRIVFPASRPAICSRNTTCPAPTSRYHITLSCARRAICSSVSGPARYHKKALRKDGTNGWRPRQARQPHEYHCSCPSEKPRRRHSDAMTKTTTNAQFNYLAHR